MHLGRLGTLLSVCFSTWVAGMLAPVEQAALGQALINGSIVAALIVLFWWAATHDVIEWAKGATRKVEPWHLQVIGLGGVIVFASIALAGVVWERYRTAQSLTKSVVTNLATEERSGPIRWTFGRDGSPLGVSRSSGGPLWIDAFQIKGVNLGDDPIVPKGAIVRSDITARVLPLKFSMSDGELVEPEAVTIVPDGAFTLIGRIPPTDPAKDLGIIVDQFRQEFGQFTFVFEYNVGTTYTRRFRWTEVESLLSKADHDTRQSLEHANQFAGVVRRTVAAPERPPAKSSSEVAALLGFVERGFNIRDTFMRDNESIRIATDRAAWVKAVETYIAENLELAHLAKFKAGRGDGQYPVGRSAKGGAFWSDIGGKINALNNIIDELRSNQSEGIRV
jgi:hypothetical protein